MVMGAFSFIPDEVFWCKTREGDRRGLRCKRKVNPNPGEAPCSTENKKNCHDLANDKYSNKLQICTLNL